MASLRRPVPSAGLLRFLRSQSENLSFFNPNNASACGPGHDLRNSWCAAKRRAQEYARGSQALSSSGRRASLQAGMLNLESMIRSQPSRSPPKLRDKDLRLLASHAASDARYSSSTQKPSPRKPTWRERIWGPAARKEAKPLEPDDIPSQDGDGDHISMFSTPRQLSKKAALEPRLRCTEVDENGNAILIDGEFKKSELIARFGLLPRDLRKIDSSNLPHILVRPTSILLNLLHLKVLIKHNRVLLFDVYGSKASYPQSAFMYDLQGKLQLKTSSQSQSQSQARSQPQPQSQSQSQSRSQSQPQSQPQSQSQSQSQSQTNSNSNVAGLPYEFRALEAVLQSVTQELEADFEAVRDPVIRILSELEDDIDRHKLRILLILSKRVSTFEQKAKLVRDAIEELLEADDDLAAMYLTEKTHDLYRGVDDHTEVEMLLESYHKLCDEIVQEAQNLVSGIRNTEEIIRAILDANRNALMLLDLKFSVGTLGLAMGTFIAGLYGMNLENFIEETGWGFSGVTAVSVLFSLLVCRYGLLKLRKVQRVKMQGDESLGGGLGGVPSHDYLRWLRDEGGHPGLLLDPRNREKLRRLNSLKAAANNEIKAGRKKWWRITD